MPPSQCMGYCAWLQAGLIVSLSCCRRNLRGRSMKGFW